MKMAPQYNHDASSFSTIKTSIISAVQHIPPYKNEFFLREKYLVEMLSTRQIAALVFSARSTVVRHLRAYGIPMRREDEAHDLNNGQCSFGEKMVAGKAAPHKGELVVLRRMQTLRNNGLSYWKIAAQLNSSGVPTKNRKTKWHATTVMKMLKKTTKVGS